jgi:hypothetical protein
MTVPLVSFRNNGDVNTVPRWRLLMPISVDPLDIPRMQTNFKKYNMSITVFKSDMYQNDIKNEFFPVENPSLLQNKDYSLNTVSGNNK